MSKILDFSGGMFYNKQLTFPEFHYETEAKVDFSSACI